MSSADVENDIMSIFADLGPSEGPLVHHGVPLVPGGGNSILPTRRVNPSKKWCFTLNNPTTDERTRLGAIGANSSMVEAYMWEDEISDSGTEHLQGFIIWYKKVRPVSASGIVRAHWTKMKGSLEQNIAYCSKTGINVITNQDYNEPVIVLREDQLFTWQIELRDLLIVSPDDRMINWYFDLDGNTGKSIFCKYMVVKHKAMLVSGKGNDMKYAIASTAIKPKIVIIDVPRSVNPDFISYQGIEEIKNGLFFSGKYESSQVVMNPPHIVIFANFPPDESKFSEDRWNIIKIDERMLPEETPYLNN